MIRKLDLMGNLLCVLQKECVSTDMDKLMWKGSKGNDFSVKEAFMLFQPNSGNRFLKKEFGCLMSLRKLLFA